MSNVNILNLLSEAQKAKLASLLDGEAVQAKPSKRSFAPKDDAWRAGEASYAQKMKLISLFDERQVDPEGIALTGYWDDGSDLTFGELFTVEDRDGGKRNFPVLWTGLTAGEASDLRAAMIDLPAKPEAEMPKYKRSEAAKSKRSFAPKPKASGSDEATDLRFAKIEAILMQLAEGQLRESAQPAKPVAAPGHTKQPKAARVKAHQPKADVIAYDDHGQPVSEADLMAVDLAKGQIVRWEGQLFKLTRQANGRIGQQRIG